MVRTIMSRDFGGSMVMKFRFQNRTLSLVWLTLVFVCGLPLSNARDPAERPNVVLILADDHCYRDFGFMGNNQVHTPNIDRLAKKSARYINGYVPMSVCRPSLATLLTGLYPHQHDIHFNHPPPGLSAMRKMTAAEYEATRATTDHLIQRVPTLPRILAKHGYACLQTGKHWEGSYKTAGFTHGMTLGKPASRLGPVTGTRTQTNGEWVAHGNGDAGLVIGRETMQPIYDFVNEHKSKQPFLVWYAPFLPHTPFDAPQRFHDVYKGSDDIPKYLLPYYAEIARFDETVGDLLEFLEETGQLSNTIIVFASDNGFRPHETKREAYNGRSKLSQFEDGLRTPVLIRWDGHVKPNTHEALVQTTDIIPTILSAAGLSEEQLPDIEMAMPEGLKVYPDQAELHTGLNNERLVSQKVKNFAIVANKAGVYQLPEIIIPWWNTVTNQYQQAVIPAQTITVDANPEQIAQAPISLASEMPDLNAQSDSTTKTVTVYQSTWLQWLFLALWLITSFAWFITYIRRNKSSSSTTKTTKINDNYLALLAACKQHNGEQALAILVPWYNSMVDKKISTIADINHHTQHDTLISAINDLQQCTYSKNTQPWLGDDLMKAVIAVNKQPTISSSQTFAINP